MWQQWHIKDYRDYLHTHTHIEVVISSHTHILRLLLAWANKLVLHDARHVSNLHLNPISIRKLDEEDTSTPSEKINGKVSRDPHHSTGKEMLYTLQDESKFCRSIVNAMEQDVSEISHQWLGHIERQMHRRNVILIFEIRDGSLASAFYFVIFTDDFSRKTWAYLLKHKWKVFEVLKQFIARWNGK